VLITAASSSAGIAAMEVCRMVGAKTIGTSRSTNNHAFLKDIGFDHVIAQTDGNMSESIMEFTGGKGVRIVYDPVGGAIVQEYADAFAQNAIVFLYGGMDPTETTLPEMQMTEKAVVFMPYTLYNYIYDKEGRERGLKFCYDGLKSGQLRPFVEKVFPIEEFKEAFEYQQKATRRVGKLLISPGGK